LDGLKSIWRKELLELAYKIIRSKRRTVALVITKDATLEVRAPLRVSLNVIKEFVDKKKTWIKNKIELINQERVLPKKFEEGEDFIYEGNAYKLQISDGKDISISSVLHFPKKLLPEARQHLIVWYKKQAFTKIVERVDHYANITRLEYKAVKLTNAERRWGSCSCKGSLNISWRLIMAPPDILDYIIVHELIHLIERNHSKQFWDRVQTILPNYKEQERWLKQRGNTLML
jgi:predicted metal-dependent hydrolase